MIGFLSRLFHDVRPPCREAKRRENDHFALDEVAGHMLTDYAQAVAEGAGRDVLAQILTGLAGCELAMSRTNPAMGWGEEADEEGYTVGHSARLSGLLLLEIADAVRLWPLYGGPTAPPFAGHETIAAALDALGRSYNAAGLNRTSNLMLETPVGQRLSDLWHATPGVIGSQAAEILVPLMHAHGHTPVWETTDSDDPVSFQEPPVNDTAQE
jgi:hypothetical protein